MKKAILGALFAGAMLASCSSDEPANNGGNQGNNESGYGYVAVNIVQPATEGGRAAEETDFEPGTPEENKASNALFYIFSSVGDTQIGTAQNIALIPTNESNALNPAVEQIYQAVLVIDGEETKPTVGYQIVCVLNAPAGMEKKVEGLTALTKLIADYSIHSDNNFIMTNSVYKNGTDVVLGARVTEANLKNSASEAKANPVDVYVERVVAKIKSNKPSEITSKGGKALVDGVEKTFDIEVTGIEVANIAQTSYLFKNVTGINYDWAWDVPNKRSYWETMSGALTYGNKSYTQIATGTSTGLNEYIQPNTSNQKTSVLVTAQLKDGDKTADLVWIRGGYTTMDGATALVAQYLADNGNYYKKAADWAEDNLHYVQLGTKDFKWVNNNDVTGDDAVTVPGLTAGELKLKSYEAIAVLADGVEVYKKSVNETSGEKEYTKADASDVNTLLLAKNNKGGYMYAARVYTEGKCYYFVNIDQTSVAISNGYTVAEGAAKTHVFDGVVRNHIYDLSLKDITGIGTPVFDPDDVIVPTKPEDEQLWYLAARIKVLKWRLVKQNVSFEGQ